MTDILTAAEMRAVEKAAIDSGAVTGLELMERAGQGVVDAVFAEWPDLSRGAHRAVVFCGPGNNGGDGLVIARLLAGQGWEIDLYLYGDPARLPPDAASNAARWRALGPIRPLAEFAGRGEWRTDLVVDALFGTGLTRPLADLDSLLSNIADAADLNTDPLTDLAAVDAPRVVAVDLPSGLSTDTGEVLLAPGMGTGAARANLTVTFHREKRGHRSGAGPEHTGRVVVCDIGLDPRA